MDTTATIFSTLSIYLTQCPLFLVWLAGIALAVTHRRRRPRVARLTLIALLIVFFETLLNSFLGMWLPIWLIEQGIASTQIGVVLGIWRFIASIVGAIVWALLLVAIFGWPLGSEHEPLEVPVPTENYRG